MQLNPYLFFNGQCEAAFKFYEQRLGGKIVAMMTYGEMPAEEQGSAQKSRAIVHARLMVGDTALMGSDCPPEHYKTLQGVSMSLQVADPAEAERVFAALQEGGTVTMPMEETFWAVRFGMLDDQFGISWMVNCGKAA